MPGAEAPGTEKPAVVTQVFKLKYADATKLDTIVKPFLTQPGATSFPLAGQELLVVTDYAANLKRVADLVQSIDQPSEETTIEFFPVKHADPARLTQQLDQLLKAKLHSEGGDDRLANTVETAYDVRTNQVVVIAAKSRMADARRGEGAGHGHPRGAESSSILQTGQRDGSRCVDDDPQPGRGTGIAGWPVNDAANTRPAPLASRIRLRKRFRSRTCRIWDRAVRPDLARERAEFGRSRIGRSPWPPRAVRQRAVPAAKPPALRSRPGRPIHCPRCVTPANPGKGK